MALTTAQNSPKTIGPELSLLASQAATAIDRHISGKETKFDVVEQLVEFLRDTIETPNSICAEHMFVLPGTLEVFNSAISFSRPGSPIGTVSVLAEEARKIINNLSQNVSEQNDDQLPRLRDFCAAFSIATSNYLMKTYEMEPAHPNRW